MGDVCLAGGRESPRRLSGSRRIRRARRARSSLKKQSRPRVMSGGSVYDETPIGSVDKACDVALGSEKEQMVRGAPMKKFERHRSVTRPDMAPFVSLQIIFALTVLATGLVGGIVGAIKRDWAMAIPHFVVSIAVILTPCAVTLSHAKLWRNLGALLVFLVTLVAFWSIVTIINQGITDKLKSATNITCVVIYSIAIIAASYTITRMKKNDTQILKTYNQYVEKKFKRKNLSDNESLDTATPSEVNVTITQHSNV